MNDPTMRLRVEVALAKLSRTERRALSRMPIWAHESDTYSRRLIELGLAVEIGGAVFRTKLGMRVAARLPGLGSSEFSK